MKKIILLLAVSVLFSGCARDAGLQGATARSIQGSFLPSEIEVIERDWSIQTVEWIAADSDGQTYNCFADDMLRKPTCRKR